jgi:hypothetical protein
MRFAKSVVIGWDSRPANSAADDAAPMSGI